MNINVTSDPEVFRGQNTPVKIIMLLECPMSAPDKSLYSKLAIQEKSVFMRMFIWPSNQ